MSVPIALIPNGRKMKEQQAGLSHLSRKSGSEFGACPSGAGFKNGLHLWGGDGARALSDPMESESSSRSLFCRIFTTRTGDHFAGKCSKLSAVILFSS